jgi:hypothetical protein
MAKLRCCGPALLVFVVSCLVCCFVPCPVFGQGWYAFHPNEEVRVPQLPAVKAKSDDPSDVLLTSLDLVFHDKSICCGRDSALEDRALAANPLSLKEIASRLEGRQLLSDGRPIQVMADFLPAGANVDASYWILSNLREKHAMLMVWGSHLYVLYGAMFDETAYGDGTSLSVIHKLLLLDTRYSDSRREVVFNRDTDDWEKVQGMLLLTFAPL